ncbi:phospho-sugar mutase [Aureivirga marina]|uniref:phospho-sugar mutase n=1 Tax=Aureivirga marina TaxID=1182451 RepID=UPI0018CAB62C|nr:phospho-sugar mutase [Aureivirga marina]
MEEILEKANLWLSDAFDTETKNEIQDLIDNNPEKLKDAFYKNLEFGTGGMRGIMGAGINRINKYTLGKATQGLSNYLHKNFPNKEIKVAIAYDCRKNSDTFAKIVADVFTANNIKVYLFDDMRPTPELSFTVRHLGCDAGIVLTASHNPPEYNGYKVYWNDGAQIVPPHDKNIIDEVNKLDFSEIKFDGNDDLITYEGCAIDDAFMEASLTNGCFAEADREKLNVVFTSLHGTSIKIVPKVLRRAGYSNVHIVREQMEPDGNFPTVESPNPEEPAALAMALTLADEVDADIVIGTDPDSDRVGIAVRDLDGKMILLNGNQTMSIMTDFLIKKWQEKGKLNGNQFVGSTIVSTNLVNDIAAKYDVDCKVGLTGFKWIAKMIRDFDSMEFIGGGEESFGYMVGDFVRDKDAVTATLLACEIAMDAKLRGSTLYKDLLEIYKEHSFYKEHLVALVKKGIEGAELIKKMMIDLRENPKKEIAGHTVTHVEDYASSERKNILTGEIETIDVPKSNVLIYYTEDGSKIAARPSGTEPKIKFYFSVKLPLDAIENAKEVEKQLDAKINEFCKEFGL